MSEAKKELSGPYLAEGLALSKAADGAMLLGHAHGEAVLLARRGDDLFAIGAACTHYGAPLAAGLPAEDTVRCPWHRACFSLHTGAAAACERRRTQIGRYRGGGAAGNAAAEMLRREGAVVHRDLEGLRVEVEFERTLATKSDAVIA